MMPTAEFTDDTPLPPVREELRFMKAAQDAGARDGWLILDPLRNTYFRITAMTARALACWRAGTAGALRSTLERRHGLHVTLEDVQALVLFLKRNGLLQPSPGEWPGFAAQARRLHGTVLKRLLHGYLFFRIPLVRPGRMLKALLPRVRWLGTRRGIALVVFLSLVGLFLTGRQWDVFRATFLGFLTPEGFLLFAVTLVFVKIGHELGHALIATHFGCRVPTMGIAFLVMLPMLYTDVTDAWKVRSRRARLLIDAGGILVELGLAGIALLLWAFLPEGPMRSAAFFVATTSLATTLLVNASPFMRFDGYHILADVLRMHNLAPRAFAMATWLLRRWILGLREPPPERLSDGMRRLLVAYAFAAWLYRLVLFLGIALLVYHAFPKVVGMFLAGVEVTWFIVRPVWREIGGWWKMRGEVVERGRPWRPVLLLAGILLLLLAPVWGSVRVPAVMKAGLQMELYAPEPARIEKVALEPGMRVSAGEPLVVLRSRDLEFRERQARERLRLVRLRLRRLAADRQDLEEHAVLLRRRAALERELAGLAERRERLVLRAAFDGRVTHVASGLRPGMWVNETVMLARVVAPEDRVVSALVPEEDVDRLRPGAKAIFVPDDPGLSGVPMELREIGAVRRSGRDLAYLSSIHGGPVPAERDERGQIHTLKGMFPVRFLMRRNDAEEGGAERLCPMTCTGRIIVEARRESLAGRMARRVLSVLLRESGF